MRPAEPAERRDSKQRRQRLDPRWWRDPSPHLAIQGALAGAERGDSDRRSDDETHLRMYSEREWSLYTGARLRSGVTARSRARKRRRLSLNVVRNNIDAWVNMVCRNRPHINFLTKGADWGLQKKARLRTRFVEAHFLKRGIYALDSRVAKHAGIFGAGFVHVVKHHGRIDYEIVLPSELRVNAAEAMADDPRSLYRDRDMDKEVACELWPEHADKIRAESGDRVRLVDAWHLQSGPDAGDGRHMQCIPGCVTLSDRPYRWDHFPIVAYRFDDAPLGWWGQGIAEELTGIQIEINAILRTIQNNTYFGGNLKAAVPRGSNIHQSGLSNALGVPIVEYNGGSNGGPPVFFANDIASPQLFQHLDRLRTEASEIIGLSQLNAESQTPYASMSGRARLVHNQTENRRFSTHQQRYEDYHRALAERTLEAAADLDEQGEDIEIIFPGRDHLEVIKYSDVATESPEDFDCEAWSASLAGETPAARLAQIEQMMTMGMIDLAGAMYLYEIPHDLRAHMEAVLAPIELAREAIDRIIEDGEPMTPTPMMDLQMAAQHAQLWYQRGVLRGVDPQRLYLLLDFHRMALWMLQRAQPANTNAQAAAAGQGAPAQGTGQTLAAAPVQVAAGF